MNKLKSYFQSVGPRRIIGMVIGNIIVGIGCAMFKWAALGNDPYSAGCMALSAVFGIQYGLFNVIYNIFFFGFEIIWGRKYIGIGTIVNWFGVGFVVQWVYEGLIHLGAPQNFGQQMLIILPAIVIVCIGLSFYQTSDTGVSPYDSLSLMMHDYWHIPYFWCRMITDCMSVAICYFGGGLLGIGTLICAFGLGPIVHLFNRLFVEKILKHRVA